MPIPSKKSSRSNLVQIIWIMLLSSIFSPDYESYSHKKVYLCSVLRTREMKRLAKLLKFSFIVLGWVGLYSPYYVILLLKMRKQIFWQ